MKRYYTVGGREPHHDREWDKGVFGISHSLVEARTSAGLTQAELARRTSVPTRLVEQWERGEATPSIAIVEEIAKLTGTIVRVSLVSPEAGSGAERQADSPAHAALGDAGIMTIDEVAEFLRLNRKTVYELARQGKIPVRRVGRSLRASREAVLRWLSEESLPRQRRPMQSARSAVITAASASRANR